MHGCRHTRHVIVLCLALFLHHGKGMYSLSRFVMYTCVCVCMHERFACVLVCVCVCVFTLIKEESVRETNEMHFILAWASAKESVSRTPS